MTRQPISPRRLLWSKNDRHAAARYQVYLVVQMGMRTGPTDSQIILAKTHQSHMLRSHILKLAEDVSLCEATGTKQGSMAVYNRMLKLSGMILQLLSSNREPSIRTHLSGKVAHMALRIVTAELFQKNIHPAVTSYGLPWLPSPLETVDKWLVIPVSLSKHCLIHYIGNV